MRSPLEQAVRRFRPRREPEDGSISARLPAAAFRSGVEQRLRNLEREMSEIKSRINGLLFLVAGAVITQLLLKLTQ